MPCNAGAIRGIRTIILTEGESQRANLVSYCIQNYGQNELVLPEYDFAGIRYLLTPEQSLKNYFLNNFDFEELDQPIDGYKYMVNGELTNIFDIVGMPPRVLRRVKRANSPKYLLVSSPKERNLFYRHYPEHESDPDTIVYVLSEILKANPDAMSPAKEQTHDKWARIFQNYVQTDGRRTISLKINFAQVINAVTIALAVILFCFTMIKLTPGSSDMAADFIIGAIMGLWQLARPER